MIQKVNDLNWWIEYQGVKLYWYEKVLLLSKRNFMKAIRRLRRFVECGKNENTENDRIIIVLKEGKFVRGNRAKIPWILIDKQADL